MATTLEELEGFALPKLVAINNGVDDKTSVYANIYYKNGSTETVAVASKISKGDTITIDLKSTVSGFSILCQYDGALRVVGRAKAEDGSGFTRCVQWWLWSKGVEESQTYGY